MAQLTCEGLALGYEGFTLVDNLSFQVHAGDYLCVVGENGSGKSTLMRTLLGLQKPLRGKITLGDGLKSTDIGYLPQRSGAQQDFPATVWEVVRSGCQARAGLRPWYSREETALAEENLAAMGVEGLKKRSFRQLSGGQQQRVLLARALCATRKLLLMDEPVAGLDPRSTQEMYGLIRQLNRQQELTVIMISHDLAAAVSEATHILHLGRQVFFGTRGEFAASPLARQLTEGGEAP